MITYSIKPKGLVGSWVQGFVDHVVRPISQIQYQRKPSVEIPRTREHWSKARFALWIEGVKLSYQKGDLVTFKAVPPRENTIPVHWKVAYVEELYSLAEFDHILDEPCALTLQTMTNTFLKKCPKVMRKLTLEEKALVDLSNKVPQGTC